MPEYEPTSVLFLKSAKESRPHTLASYLGVTDGLYIVNLYASMSYTILNLSSQTKPDMHIILRSRSIPVTILAHYMNLASQKITPIPPFHSSFHHSYV